MPYFVIAGFQHETNTFSPHKASLKAFKQADVWPAWLQGDALFSALQGQNIPMAGFIAEAQKSHTLMPAAWASAPPSGSVEQEVFDTFLEQLLRCIENAPRIDGLYLDLHGAMVTEKYLDAEGALLMRIREVLPQVPIVVSLDFHANISKELFELSDQLLVFRTYPHVDMALTGQKAAQCLEALCQKKNQEKHMRQLPFLIPLPGQCTLNAPMKNLFQTLESLEQEYQVQLSFAPGFPLADTPCTGPVVLGYGQNAERVKNAVQSLSESIIARKEEMLLPLFTPEEAFEEPLAKNGPTILVDTQDNSGAGGTSDTMGLAQALLHKKLHALCGVILDPETALQAHQTGIGNTFEGLLGGKNVPGGPPLKADFIVLALSNGELTCTGPYYNQCKMQLGPMAAIQAGTVTFVVSSKKVQAADQALFTHLGLDVWERPYLALKSSVHFRADFAEGAGKILLINSPGLNYADLKQLDFKHCQSSL